MTFRLNFLVQEWNLSLRVHCLSRGVASYITRVTISTTNVASSVLIGHGSLSSAINQTVRRERILFENDSLYEFSHYIRTRLNMYVLSLMV